MKNIKQGYWTALNEKGYILIKHISALQSKPFKPLKYLPSNQKPVLAVKSS